eukprot:scaffold13682_cov139-Skeletonema_menzelii.AAC.1
MSSLRSRALQLVSANDDARLLSLREVILAVHVEELKQSDATLATYKTQRRFQYTMQPSLEHPIGCVIVGYCCGFRLAGPKYLPASAKRSTPMYIIA